MTSRPKLDIVIPARDEANTLGAALLALLCDAQKMELCVCVALNGEGAQEMADVVESFVQIFRASGHDLRHVTTQTVGKTGALNAAEALCCGDGPIVYLDANTVILPGTLDAIAARLAVSEPFLVGACLQAVLPKQKLARDFVRVWQHLPNVSNVIGGGLYAVNRPGRARWAEFPPIVADDAFVFRCFAPAEREVCRQAGLWLGFPEGKSLPKRIRRWHEGNRALDARDPSAASGSQNSALLRVLLRRALFVPGFLAVKVWSRLLRFETSGIDWRPERAVSEPVPARRLRVRVVIVTFESEDWIENCLSSVTSRFSEVEIVVVDNNSADLSADLAEAHAARPKVVRHQDNLGFARAVNQAAADGEFDYLLLLNPDAELGRDTIDVLISLALHRPEAGVYGGRMVKPDGDLDASSALAFPGHWHAIAFALCLSAIPPLRFLDPDSLLGWDRQGTRFVPALTAACLLISDKVWQKSGGLDEGFFLYGGDVDFSIKANMHGGCPLHTSLATYTHNGGSSSDSHALRTLRIVAGKAELYRRYAPLFGVFFLTTGVALRALAEFVSAKDGSWRYCWRNRRTWLNKPQAREERLTA